MTTKKSKTLRPVLIFVASAVCRAFDRDTLNVLKLKAKIMKLWPHIVDHFVIYTRNVIRFSCLFFRSLSRFGCSHSKQTNKRWCYNRFNSTGKIEAKKKTELMTMDRECSLILPLQKNSIRKKSSWFCDGYLSLFIHFKVV